MKKNKKKHTQERRKNCFLPWFLPYLRLKQALSIAPNGLYKETLPSLRGSTMSGTLTAGGFSGAAGATFVSTALAKRPPGMRPRDLWIETMTSPLKGLRRCETTNSVFEAF